jgi:hypothetical protein
VVTTVVTTIVVTAVVTVDAPSSNYFIPMMKLRVCKNGSDV